MCDLFAANPFYSQIALILSPLFCGIIIFCDTSAAVFKVLKNGVEVKLQRNALSVLEHPAGNEVDDDNDFDNSSSGSDMGEKDHGFCKSNDFMSEEHS